MWAFLRANAAFLTAGFLLTLTSSYGQTFFISIFSGEIRAAFGLTHGQWGTIYAVGTFASAIAMLWAGQLTDRFRARTLSLVILPLFAGVCLAMSQITAVWALVLVIFGLRLCGQGMTSQIATVAMARWFVATRGRALSLASMGFALGEAVLPITFVALLAVVEWRLLWGVAALLILAVLPALRRLLALERTPQAVAAENEASGMRARHWDRLSVLRHPLFWCIVPVLLGPAAFVTAFFFHQVHFAETQDLSHLALVALFPVYTVVSVAMMLATGVLVDRFGSGWLMPLAMLPIAAAFLTLSAAAGPVGTGFGLALMAITVGSNFALISSFWAEFYGTRHLGGVKAMGAAIMVLGTAIGPILTGLLIDEGIPLDTQMTGIAVYFLLAAILALLGISRAIRDLPVATRSETPA